jgi:mRNA-degrading endonuclease HigB of HigAB toxin-antitoxin module
VSGRRRIASALAGVRIARQQPRYHCDLPNSRSYRYSPGAKWKNLTNGSQVDVRKTFPHADAVGRCTVFNIHGNRFRLIARINYEWRKVYILGIYTHKEYDEGEWKHGCESN